MKINFLFRFLKKKKLEDLWGRLKLDSFDTKVVCLLDMKVFLMPCYVYDIIEILINEK